MHRVTIQYGVPQDPGAFDERYFDHHVPLVAPIPGLHSFTWSKPRPLGGDHSVYLVAELDFHGEEALELAYPQPDWRTNRCRSRRHPRQMSESPASMSTYLASAAMLRCACRTPCSG